MSQFYFLGSKVDARINRVKGEPNGLASLDEEGRLPDLQASRAVGALRVTGNDTTPLVFEPPIVALRSGEVKAYEFPSLVNGTGAVVSVHKVGSSVTHVGFAVQTGAGRRIVHSTNGLSWTTVASSPFNNTPQALVWCPKYERLLLTGPGSGVYTSDDLGVTWTLRIAGDGGGALWVDSLERFVVVMGDSKIHHSGDGVTWTEAAGASTIGAYWLTLTWSPELNLFCSSTADFLTHAVSSDGVVWTGAAGEAGEYSSAVQSCTWNPKMRKFVAVAAFSNIESYTSRLWTSANGLSWGILNQGDTTFSGIYGVSWDPYLEAMVGMQKYGIFTSETGVGWGPIPSTSLPFTDSFAQWFYLVWREADRSLVGMGQAFSGGWGVYSLIIPRRELLFACAKSADSAPLLRVVDDAVVVNQLTMKGAVPSISVPSNTLEILLDSSNLGTSESLVVRKNAATAGTGGTTLFALDSAGNLGLGGAVSTLSDASLKTDVQVIPDAMAKVKQLHGYTYLWRDDPERPRAAGLIAQEVEKVLPEAVRTDPVSGEKSLYYDMIIALLIEALRQVSP